MKYLINKIMKFYESIDLSTKSLIIIGFISLIQTVITIFFDAEQTSPNDVAIRSIMASIFGFIFGSQLSENSNIKSRNIQTTTAIIVALVCLNTVILAHWFQANQDEAAAVEVRNLLFSAVGFLLSRAKHSV